MREDAKASEALEITSFVDFREVGKARPLRFPSWTSPVRPRSPALEVPSGGGEDFSSAAASASCAPRLVRPAIARLSDDQAPSESRTQGSASAKRADQSRERPD